MGNAQTLTDQVLENTKCARMLRLKLKRFEAIASTLQSHGMRFCVSCAIPDEAWVAVPVGS